MHPIAVSPFKMDTRGDKPVGPSRGVSTTTGHSATDTETPTTLATSTVHCMGTLGLTFALLSFPCLERNISALNAHVGKQMYIFLTYQMSFFEVCKSVVSILM